MTPQRRKKPLPAPTHANAGADAKTDAGASAREAAPAATPARAASPAPHGTKSVTFKGFTLNAFQVQAVEAIEAGKNVLLSAPTGSGKTLVAEYAIETAAQQNRRVIYTSPIKALSNQKFRDFKADGIEVGLMTGDLTLYPHAPVVIMTTEIFRNAVFEETVRFEDVDFVIFDEIHFLDDPERGTVWEESLIFAPPHVRFVCLSATIANLAQFGKWITSVRPHELAVIHSDKRPVPLDHQLFHVDSGMFRLAQRKRAVQMMHRREAREHVRRHGGDGRGRGGARGRDRDRRRPGMRARRTAHVAHAQTQMVLDHLQRHRLLPALFFCFSRRECEIKADRNLYRNLLSRDEQNRMEVLFRDVAAKFELDVDQDPGLAAIFRRAMRGIGFHHAGMLPIHKEVVERLFTSGLLKLLFTTETFAMGINMPARTVVFDSLRKFDGVSFDYMRTRDYMQMAGRAGRQGIDDAGLVISILDDDDLEDAPLAELFGQKVEPITSRFNLSYSTILNLYERMGADLVEAYDRSFAAFQALGGTEKKRERQRSIARAQLRARMAVLEDTGYIGPEGLLPRGKIAQQVNGYEIQVTELLFAGVLDDMDIHQLAATFAALIYEERRGDGAPTPGRNALGSFAPKVELAVRRFIRAELEHGFRDVIKMPAWSIAPAVLAWSQGADIAAVEKMIDVDGGDLVRTLRMAVQLMRQLRSGLSGDYGLIDRLQESVVSINRDVVDARRQFELG